MCLKLMNPFLGMVVITLTVYNESYLNLALIYFYVKSENACNISIFCTDTPWWAVVLPLYMD